jgi:hypothetical protein
MQALFQLSYSPEIEGRIKGAGADIGQLKNEEEIQTKGRASSRYEPQSPTVGEMVGGTGVEPATSCVSCKRSNQLS